MSTVGCIGDPHEPVSRAGYLDFCSDTFEEYGVDEVVCIGDLIDWHGISFHARQPECPGPADEYTLALERVQRWYRRFPNMKWVIGNHDQRPARLARTVSIPEFMLKPYNEIWGVPEWELDFEFMIDGVKYLHGTGNSGVHPAWNLMNKSKMSVVMGHCHSRAGVKHSTNRKERFFGLDTGCGVDDRTYQFAYGKNLPERSFLACGIVKDGWLPLSIPMKCGRGEKYHDSKFPAPGKPLVFIGKWGNKGQLKTKVPIHYATWLQGGTTKTACKTEGLFQATTVLQEVTCGNCKRTSAFKEAVKATEADDEQSGM